jgi:hypothetical protein
MENLEYHIYNVVDGKSQAQAYVFTVSRDQEQKNLHIHEIWAIIKIAGKDYKTRLDLDALAANMWSHPGGTVAPQQHENLHQLFAEVIPSTVLTEHQSQIMYDAIKDMSPTSSQLISASISAQSAHPTGLDIDFDELIKHKFSPRNN